MSLRRFVNLLENLPSESAYARANGAWTLAEQLAAVNVETLWWANWQRGGGKDRKPKQIPRPGVAKTTSGDEGGDVMTLDQAKAWSDARKARWAEQKGGD